MKQTITVCALLVLIACNSETKPVAEAKVVAAVTTTPSEPMPDSATMAQNWQTYMTPGKEHAEMAAWSGKWEGEVTMWENADSKPTTSIMTATNEMILGGRYQRSTNKGDFMDMPFEGVSTLAYDNAKKIYVSSWIDNMGTGVMNMEGTYDAATKTMNMTGKCVNPATGKEQAVRETFTLVDADHQIMQMYNTGADGKEFKAMQIVYTRKK